MAETENTPVENMVEGVRKSIIQERLDNYRRQVYGLTDEQKAGIQTQIDTVQRVIDRLVRDFDDDPENETLRDRIQTNERRLQELRNELANSGPTVEPNTEEYYRMADVIPELEDILAHADPDLEYVPIEEIQRRLAEQRRLRDELVAAQRGPVHTMSEEDMRLLEVRITELEAEYARLTRLIENPEVDRDALLAEKTELERRIAEINERLSAQGNAGRGALSQEERADLEERLAAARAALNANRDTLAAKNTELENARRQRDEEIARINGAGQEEVVVESRPEDLRDQAENTLREYAEQHGIDPSELRIVRTEIEDYDDGPRNEFSIVRVRRNEEPILTVDERAALEDELRQAEEELNNLNANAKNPNDMSIDAIIAELDAQIRALTDQIVANNETPQRDDNRVAANEPLLARRAELEAQRRALNELRTNSLADIDAEIRALTDQIVANNETPQRDDNRVAANEPLLARRAELEALRRNMRNATVADRLTDLDAQIRALTDQIVANNESYANTERRMEANEPLMAQRRALEEQRNALRRATNGLDLDGNAARRTELQNRINELRARLEQDNERRAKYPRLAELDAQILGLENEIRDIEAEIQRLEGVVADLENQVREDDQIRREDEAALTDEERAALEEQLRQAREDLRKNGERRNDPNVEYEMFRIEHSRLTELIRGLEGRLALDTARRNRVGSELSDEERRALEQERAEKEARLAQVNESLENPDKAKEYWTIERERINVLILELREQLRKGREGIEDPGVDNSEQIRIAENKIKELEELEKLKEQFKGKDKPKGDPIPIPEIPKIEIELDKDKIREEYQRRKHDMYAKYYGDKDYQAEYDERAARFREHEVEMVMEDGTVYRTIEDYEQRAEDEKFLLLEDYKDALERMTKDEAGLDVYHGTPEEIEAQRAKDREYVETRNHTFDQHKYTQRDLATMGKYGEKMPYIPKQEGILKNIGRGALNVAIFARNVVAPVYRVVGKFIAQPFHRLVTRGKDASPYRNNFYHRMVARREYFAEQARARDAQETQELVQEAIANGERPEDVKPVRHTIRNWAAARWNAIFKSKEGNKAVLNAGEHDIQQNIIQQEGAAAMLRGAEAQRDIVARQLEELEAALAANPNAPNAEAVRQAIEERRQELENAARRIEDIKGNKVETRQTDAVSDKTHAVARKEINTLRTTIIKGVAKGIAAKYIGPAIEKWILEHSKIKTQEWVPESTKQEWVDETTKQEWVEGTTRQEWVDGTTVDTTVPVYGDGFPQGKTVEELIADNAGKDYTGWYSVSGGHRRPSPYTLSGDEKITGWWVDDGSKWGTGVSDAAGLTAPTLTDRLVDAGLMTPGGVFRQDVEPAEILRICQMEGIDPSKVYLSVGDNHWAKAADLFGLDRVQIGEEVVSKFIPGHWDTVDVPGFWDTVTVPGHWDTVTVPGFWKEVIKTNPAVAHLLQGGKVVARTGMVADNIHNLGENLRNTHTDVPENKPQPRRFERNPDAAELFGVEEHPESKYEYEQGRRSRDDDDDAR